MPLQELPIPPQYSALAGSSLDASTRDLAYLYSAFYEGSPTPDFSDAVRLHSLLEEIRAGQPNS